MENELQTRYDLSAVTIRIGGLAAYPAPVAHNSHLRAVLGTAAHEWVHHYMFFRPLGQAMFRSENMVTINETVADIIGRYLADHAYGILTKEGMDPILDPISHGSAMRTPGNMEFDFSVKHGIKIPVLKDKMDLEPFKGQRVHCVSEECIDRRG